MSRDVVVMKMYKNGPNLRGIGITHEDLVSECEIVILFYLNSLFYDRD